MTKIIAFVDNHSASGKTTAAIGIGVRLYQLGKKVLLIDLDPQCNLSKAFGIGDTGDTSLQTFEREHIEITKIEDGLDIIPGTINLVGAELELAGFPKKEQRLKMFLNLNKAEYDFILIDSPPTLGLLTINALAAADEVLIPITANETSSHTYDKLVYLITLVNIKWNPNLKITPWFFTKYEDDQSSERAYIRKGLHEVNGNKLFKTPISKDILYSKTDDLGMKLLKRPRPVSFAENDLQNLCIEIINSSPVSKIHRI